MHLDAHDAVALARFAAPARHVEAETGGIPASDARFRDLREQRPDLVEGLRVRPGVAPRGSPDRPLIDRDDLVDPCLAVDRAVRADAIRPVVERVRERGQQDPVHERALSRAARPGDGDEAPERQRHVDVFQVIFARAADDQGTDRFSARARAPRCSFFP